MKVSRERYMRVLVIGAIAGGLMGLTVSVLMDILYADALQGTWRDAIAKDLGSLFSTGVSVNSLAVYAVYVVVLLFLSAVGAFMGVIFAFLIYRFFLFLGSDGR